MFDRIFAFFIMAGSALLLGFFLVVHYILNTAIKVNNSTRKLASSILIVLLGVLTIVALVAMQMFSVPTSLDFEKPLEVTVPRGASLGEMAEIFDEAGLVENRWHFTLAARLTGLDRKLRAGKYVFREPLSPIGLVKALTVGGSFDITVTFPEGLTVFQVANLAADSLGISQELLLTVCFDRSFLDSLGISAPSCEGYLFPETYKLPEDISARELIARMFAHFRSIWVDSMVRRARELDMDLNEVVSLASIIEAEAHVVWEQRIISSVYHNRLRLGMLLQADPTVIYGLRSFDRPLTNEDLDTSSSPYNSYRFAGLPPGAICNPGKSAIYAALWPDSSDYLYFVSNRDGTHWFNTTAEGHHAAIRAIRGRGEHGPIPEVYNRKIMINKDL